MAGNSANARNVAMILPAILYTLKGKLLLGLATISAALLAAGEANSNQTLIVVACITMLGTVFTGIMTFISARISAGNRDGLKELSKGIDGVAHELKAAKEEGTVARVDAAHAKGQLEEREAEVARRGASALAKQDAAPTEVIQVNPPNDPANVKVAP